MSSHAFLTKTGQTKSKRRTIAVFKLFAQAIAKTKQSIVGVGGNVRDRKTIVSLDNDVVLKLIGSSSFIK